MTLLIVNRSRPRRGSDLEWGCRPNYAKQGWSLALRAHRFGVGKVARAQGGDGAGKGGGGLLDRRAETRFAEDFSRRFDLRAASIAAPADNSQPKIQLGKCLHRYRRHRTRSPATNMLRIILQYVWELYVG